MVFACLLETILPARTGPRHAEAVTIVGLDTYR
jgi:hypothetical protein